MITTYTLGTLTLTATLTLTLTIVCVRGCYLYIYTLGEVERQPEPPDSEFL
jgi:hypothetical protein